MKTEKIHGDVEAAIGWLMYELNMRGDWRLLDEWDKLRGNDWIVSTKLSEQKKNND